MPGAIEELPLFGKRRSSLRRSARATVAAPDGKMRFTPIRPPQLHLKPITFEVPHPEGKPLFTGRDWVFREMEMVALAFECKVNWIFNSYVSSSSCRSLRWTRLPPARTMLFAAGPPCCFMLIFILTEACSLLFCFCLFFHEIVSLSGNIIADVAKWRCCWSCLGQQCHFAIASR
jgi:hypothetical protein